MSFIKAYIDLNAIKSNYNSIADYVGCNVITSAVVKDNAYGLGAVNVSKSLYDVGCRDFWVAYLSEAIELRKILPIDANIYYLQGWQVEDIHYINQYHLIPVINSIGELNKIKGKGIEFVIFIDTGFSRLGIRHQEIDDILNIIKCENIKYVISHLACADDKTNKMNLSQKRLFDNALSKIRTVINVKASLSATCGALLGREYCYDLVRIGSFLYDIWQDPMLCSNNVLTIETKVLQKYDIPKGSSVGYNASYISDKTIKLAVVSIGYGDGLRRSLSNKGHILFYGNNKIYKAPIVGNISMDLTTIDVSDIPDHLTEPGMSATILSNDYRIRDMAMECNECIYEVLVGLKLTQNRTEVFYINN